MENLETKSVWSIADLCEYTGMKPGYVYQLTSKRQIPHYKPTGGRIYFMATEIKAWLLSRPVPTSDSLKSAAYERCKRKPIQQIISQGQCMA